MVISCLFSHFGPPLVFSLDQDPIPPRIPFFDYLFEAASSRRVGIRVASPRQPSFTLFQDSLQQGHLTPFLYCHKFPLFRLLDRSQIEASIAKPTDFRYNHFYFVVEATVVWKIGLLEFQGMFPGCVQVVPRSDIRLTFLSKNVLLGYQATTWERLCHVTNSHNICPPSTYALLRVLSVAPCGLFPRMYLHTVDSARDVSNDQ